MHGCSSLQWPVSTTEMGFIILRTSYSDRVVPGLIKVEKFIFSLKKMGFNQCERVITINRTTYLTCLKKLASKAT